MFYVNKVNELYNRDAILTKIILIMIFAVIE